MLFAGVKSTVSPDETSRVHAELCRLSPTIVEAVMMALTPTAFLFLNVSSNWKKSRLSSTTADACRVASKQARPQGASKQARPQGNRNIRGRTNDPMKKDLDAAAHGKY